MNKKNIRESEYIETDILMEFNNYKKYRTRSKVRQINAVIYLTDYEMRLADLRKKKNIVTINLFGRNVVGKRYGKNGDEFIEIRDKKNLKKDIIENGLLITVLSFKDKQDHKRYVEGSTILFKRKNIFNYHGNARHVMVFITNPNSNFLCKFGLESILDEQRAKKKTIYNIKRIINESREFNLIWVAKLQNLDKTLRFYFNKDVNISNINFSIDFNIFESLRARNFSPTLDIFIDDYKRKKYYTYLVIRDLNERYIATAKQYFANEKFKEYLEDILSKPIKNDKYNYFLRVLKVYKDVFDIDDETIESYKLLHESSQ